MAELIRRTFRGKTRSVDTEKFTVDATVSDESLDRYREVILADAWTKGLKQYKAHPVLLSSHKYSDLTAQIGVGERIKVENAELVTRFKYFVGEGNPQADWGFKLAEKGLAAFSVGFIPKSEMTEEELAEYSKGRKDAPRRVYKEVELLEISQVLIPANANALQKGVEDEDPVVRDLAEAIRKDADVEAVVPIEDKGWEQTENEVRHRVRDPKDFEDGSFRYMPLKKSKPRVNAIVGKLKGEDHMTIQALRFPKSDGWTLEKAKEWVKSHPVKSFDVLMDLDDGINIAEADVEVLEYGDRTVIEQRSSSPVLASMDDIRSAVDSALKTHLAPIQLQVEQLMSVLTETAEKELPDPPAPPDPAAAGYIKQIFDGLNENKQLLGG